MTTEWKLVPVEPNEEMRSAECRGDEVALPSIEDMDLVIAGCRVEIPDDISREHFRPFMRGANASLDAMAKYRLEKTLDAAAAPVPPAGEVEVIGHWFVPKDAPLQGQFIEARNTPKNWPSASFLTTFNVTPVVDRAHVTRLTAENARLQTSEVKNIESADRHHHNLVEVCKERDALKAEVVRLKSKLEEEESLHSETIDQRDWAQEAADEMAYAIGAMFRVDVGEHSNLNCPWQEASAVLNGAYEMDSDTDRQILVVQSELTKARELIARIVKSGALSHEQYEILESDCCALSAAEKLGGPECMHCHDQGEAHTGKMIDQGYWQPPEPEMVSCSYCSIAHQSAPAAKGEEPQCLLCLDKKTVPGQNHAVWVRDCPDCCGEEG